MVLPIKKFQFLVLARDLMMLQHPIIHFSQHYLSSGCLWEIKNKANFQTLSSKSDHSSLREVVVYKRF